MGIIRKQSTYSTIILYIGIIVGFIGTALIRPKILTEGEIGLIQIMLNTTALFAGVFTLGANLMTLKMFPRFQTEDHSNRGLLSLILLMGLVGSLLAIPAFYFSEFFFFSTKEGERFDGFDFNSGFYIGIFLVIVSRLFQFMLDAYIRAYHNNVLGVFSESIILRVLPIVGLLFYYTGLINFQFLVYFNMGIFLIPLLLTFFFLNRLKVFVLKKPGPFSREEKKDMKGVAMVGLFEIVSAGIILYIDTMMLQWLLGEDAVGVYTTMFFFGLVIGIPARGLIRASIVIISESYAKQDLNNIQSIYRKGSEVLLVVSGYVFLMVWGNRYSIVEYLGPVFEPGAYVIFFIALAQFFDVVTSVNYHIIAISKYYKFNVLVSILQVALLIGTNLIFIHLYGIVGAAIGSALSMLIVNLIRYAFLKTKYDLTPFSSKTGIALILFALVFVISELIPDYPNLFVNLFLKGGLISVLFLPAAYFFRCSEDINNVANKYLNKLGVKWNR